MYSSIPLFRQETGYTCTCAVAKMLLAGIGISMSEMEIEEAMQVQPEKGASPYQLMEFLKEYGFETELVLDSSTETLLTDTSLKLLLYMIWGKIPHVAIIVDTHRDGIVLHDSASGKTQIRFDELEEIWWADDTQKAFIRVKHEKL